MFHQQLFLVKICNNNNNHHPIQMMIAISVNIWWHIRSLYKMTALLLLLAASQNKGLEGIDKNQNKRQHMKNWQF